ncbi:unnamed protein product [Brassica oleracea var. botrytis]
MSTNVCQWFTLLAKHPMPVSVYRWPKRKKKTILASTGSDLKQIWKFKGNEAKPPSEAPLTHERCMGWSHLIFSTSESLCSSPLLV